MYLKKKMFFFILDQRSPLLFEPRKLLKIYNSKFDGPRIKKQK